VRRNKHRAENLELFRTKEAQRVATRATENPIKFLVDRTRNAAKKRELSFDLSEEDFTIPTDCPVLGIPLRLRDGGSDNAVSVDRLDNQLGYVRGNVAIISNRANKIKGDSTLAEVEAVIAWVRKVQGLKSGQKI
jgi:hypothetical protein